MTSRTLASWLALSIFVALTCTVTVTDAQPSGQQTAKQPNAHMTVTYERNGSYLGGWSKPVFWHGVPDRKYKGKVRGRRIQWIGTAPNKNSIRLNTNEAGRGGKPLEHWIPKGTTDIKIVVEPLVNGTGAGQLSTSVGSKNSKRKEAKPRRRKEYTITHRRQSAPSLSKKPQETQPATSSTLTGRSMKNKRRTDKLASVGDGRDTSERARKTAATGTGKLKGRYGGTEDGKAGGSTPEEGGIASPNATARGTGTVAHGMKGGTGVGQGLPSGGAIWPMIVVPASLRTFTSTMLILKDANAGQLATHWMGKIASRTTARRLRKRLKKEASDYAADRMQSNAATLVEATRHMSMEDAAQYVRRLQWEIERRYFANAAEGAAAKMRALQKQTSRASKGKASAKQPPVDSDEMRRAQVLQEAAEAKPLAGQLPRNHSYAGKDFPSSRLPSAYRAKGVRIKRNGHPDFDRHAVELPNGQQSVKIKLTGNIGRDRTLASKAAGFKTGKPPKDYTWHHVENGTTMQLIPTDLHDAVRHSGGQAMLRHRTGDLNAYRR